jgi:Ca2+-binding EF-hand superfamily protein
MMEDLEEMFLKYKDDNSTTIYPKDFLKTFKKHGFEKEKPSLYSMMEWICNANEFSGSEGMTFQEVIQYAVYFYSQRSSDEGLKYVF